MTYPSRKGLFICDVSSPRRSSTTRAWTTVRFLVVRGRTLPVHASNAAFRAPVMFGQQNLGGTGPRCHQSALVRRLRQETGPKAEPGCRSRLEDVPGAQRKRMCWLNQSTIAPDPGNWIQLLGTSGGDRREPQARPNARLRNCCEGVCRHHSHRSDGAPSDGRKSGFTRYRLPLKTAGPNC